MDEFLSCLLVVAIFGIIVWAFVPSKKKKESQTLHDLLDRGIISWDEAKAIETFEREDQIKKWVKHKLITPRQAALFLNPQKVWEEEIKKAQEAEKAREEEIQKEKTQREKSVQRAKAVSPAPQKMFRISILTAICYLALGSILLGVIALVAANYDKIPPSVRTMSTLFWLTMSAVAVFWTYIKGKIRAKEWFIVAAVGLIGANIGMVSQWFQLNGNPMDALFWWAVLSVCFIWISAKKFWAYLWYPAVISTCLFSDYFEPIYNFLTYRIPSPLAGAFGLMTLGLLAHQIAPEHNLVKVLKYWCCAGVLALCGLFDVDLSMNTAISYPIADNFGQSLRAIWALLILSAYPIYMMRGEKQIFWTLLGVLGAGLLTAMVYIPTVGALMTLFLLMMIALYGAKQNSEAIFNGVLLAMFMRLVFVHFPSPMAALMGVATLTAIGYQMAPNHKLHSLFKIGPLLASIALTIWFDIDLTDHKGITYPIIYETKWALKNIGTLLMLSAYPIWVMRRNRLAVLGIFGVLAVGLLTSIIHIPMMGALTTLFVLMMVALYGARQNSETYFDVVLFAMFARLAFIHFPSPMAALMGVATLTAIGYQMAPNHKLHDIFKIGPIIACVILAICFDVDLTEHKRTIFPIFKDATWALKNAGALLVLSAYPIYMMRKNKLGVLAILGILAISLLATFIKAPVLGIVMTLFLLSCVATYVAKNNDLRAFNFVIFLMFIRLVLAYFHLFATLATTGVGLIVLGVLILLGVWLYSKFKDRLFQYLQNRL